MNSNMETKKVWFITGSSRGFGRELVEALLVQGQKVIATARKPEKLKVLKMEYPELLETITLDVTKPNR